MSADPILIANNITSIGLSMACWWLAHVSSSVSDWHGKIIATLWGCVGMSVAVTAFARNLQIDPNPIIIISKTLLLVLCVLIARRNHPQQRNGRE